MLKRPWRQYGNSVAMLQKWIPTGLRTRLWDALIAKRLLPVWEAAVYSCLYFPFLKNRAAYILPQDLPAPEGEMHNGLPVPPRSLWHNYTDNRDWYLQVGQWESECILKTLAQSGITLGADSKILDFGCASGRLIRWFKDYAEQGEVWGCDLSAAHIEWCKAYLSPPFHFFTSTTIPHLPFEDGTFDLIYASSVFTHIETLQDAWFLELRRILKPGGALFFTIHDKHTLQILQSEKGSPGLTRLVAAYPKFVNAAFEMFTIYRYTRAQVFYDATALCDRFKTIFNCLSVTEEAHGYQTGILFQKPLV